MQMSGNKERCLGIYLPNDSRPWLRGRGWPCAKEKSLKLKRKQNEGISDIICCIKQWVSTKE